MRVICGGVGSGKTKKIIELVKEDPNGVLVVGDKRMAAEAKKELPYNKVIVFDSNKFRGTESNLYIDNVDLILQSMTTRPIVCMSVTGGMDEEEDTVGDDNDDE